MKITEFKIGASHTINRGNYESYRVEASVTMSIPQEFSMEEFYMLKEELNAELRTILIEVERNQRQTRQAIDELIKAGA
jgi:hypothetical protein